MPNRIVAVILLFALISSNCSRFFIYAGFEANHSYIADVLCVNKGRPWMHCNGRCYLMKKLKEAADKEKKQEREDQKNRFQEALLISQSDTAFFASIVTSNYPPSVTPGIISCSGSVFQPPKIA